jgi:hypothetical protein
VPGFVTVWLVSLVRRIRPLGVLADRFGPSPEKAFMFILK